MPGNPFHIESSSARISDRAAASVVRPLLTWLLQLRTYQRLYRDAQASESESFVQRALDTLSIRAELSREEEALIPSRGPLIVAANHPHGALDGLVLASAIGRRRSDVRVLTNFLLARIPELEDVCFFVDPFGGRAARARSQAGLRAAHLWLKRGGVLIVFPAGEVAHRRGERATRADSPWHPTVGRLAIATGARVLPALIEGMNSRLFYGVGRVHPALRTALLARELLKKRHTAVTVHIAPPMGAREPGRSAIDATRATQSIRAAVETLARTRSSQAVARDVHAEVIPFEIDRLPDDCRLLSSGAYDVFAADASQIPATLREIGRVREITYRAIGEGTGQTLDLDEFDERYVHLFAWDRVRRQVVGAYRIGRTDAIVASNGVRGLYTRTLFNYDDRLIERLGPALELGRSFVRAEYQKNYNALRLLWKGIAHFVRRHPEYRVLFGPVSISARYSDRSHALLRAFLEQNRLDADLAALVQAINPTHVNPAPGPLPASIETVDRLVAAAEGDGKGMPVLLRQYLKLNARLLGFNVDPQFGNALDALMMVDLLSVDVSILNRYFGRTGTAAFLSCHGAQRSAAA